MKNLKNKTTFTKRSATSRQLRHAFSFVIIAVCIFSISACAGKNKAKETAGAEPTIDMTRPPVTIKGVSATEDESNPDETVSYEKWKKDREGDDK